MRDYKKLEGKIKEVCKSKKNFAKLIGISEHSMILKLSGKNDFRQDEIEKSCEILKIPICDAHSYFFTH